jgi:hypothetical protein
MSATAKWQELETPSSLQRTALLEYFGVPPSPESELVTNIRSKRRTWQARSNSPANREKADRIKELIRRLEEHLVQGLPLAEGILSGKVDAQDLGDLPAPVFETIEELLELLKNLIRRGQYQRALDTASEGLLRFPSTPRLEQMYVETAIQLGLADRTSVSDDTLIRAYTLSGELLNQDPTSRDLWLSRFSILTLLGRFDALAEIESEARTRLGTLPSAITIGVAEALLSIGRGRDGIARLVLAVEAPDADSGVRGRAVDVALAEARRQLPITSKDSLEWFTQVVDVAAWCARGLGAEEAAVRPYRMWAARAGNRMFTGDRPLRTLLAVLTGFLWVQFHNRRRSEFVWKILLEGPSSDGSDNFEVVTSAAYVQQVHQDVRFSWTSNGSWPRGK